MRVRVRMCARVCVWCVRARTRMCVLCLSLSGTLSTLSRDKTSKVEIYKHLITKHIARYLFDPDFFLSAWLTAERVTVTARLPVADASAVVSELLEASPYVMTRSRGGVFRSRGVRAPDKNYACVRVCPFHISHPQIPTFPPLSHNLAPTRSHSLASPTLMILLLSYSATEKDSKCDLQQCSFSYCWLQWCFRGVHWSGWEL